MRLLFTVILSIILLNGRAWAQEENVSIAASALQGVLSNLKQSVEKLSLDNDQLTAKDNYIKQQVLQLQAQLGQLEAQGNVLNTAAVKLQDKNTRRARKIAQMEATNFDLDNRTQKAEASIKLIQKSLDAGYQEDQRLLLQLKGMTNILPEAPKAQPLESPSANRRQKEKLRLMKMVYDSQQRQELLHESILEFQKNTALLPAASALAHQQNLKEQIKDLEAEIAAYPQEKSLGNSEVANQWDNTQLRQLELELKVLERNYAQLKNLMEEMGKKVQGSQMTVSENVEGQKLQGSMDDLSRQSEGLRASLDDLRTQMIDLDKRKSHLEAMIQQLP